MKIIKGFEKAKPFLTRTTTFEFSLPQKERKPEVQPIGEEIVGKIIAKVRQQGDKALFDYTMKLDRVNLTSLEVTRSEVSAAYKIVDPKVVTALRLAADRITKFHAICKNKTETNFTIRGLGRQSHSLDRVGIYVPGGTAAYPSTVLMTAIPARVAGVAEIIITTPPQKDGTIPAPTLVAADIAGVNRTFKIGGAQAIAALAFGTESVPKVDKICGPGNIFVVLAKKMVYGTVDIDGLQGPSEIIIVADKTANVAFCAADLIAQAEHDAMASAILITTSAKFAEDVGKEIKAQLSKLPRQGIATEAISSRGLIVVVGNQDEAFELVNLYAPEHLSLMVSNASACVPKIRNAGCIFVGGDSPVALGDYIAGPSHVLPTGGSARFSSPLSIKDFTKTTNIVALSEAQGKRLGRAAMTLAKAEGLDGHAQAIARRLES